MIFYVVERTGWTIPDMAKLTYIQLKAALDYYEEHPVTQVEVVNL